MRRLIAGLLLLAGLPLAAPAEAQQNLTVQDVNRIIAQAVNEANARGKPATIAVVDRVGNVLGVTQMAGAPPGLTITTKRGVTTGLENPGIIGVVPSTLSAITKAVTGAYLSSSFGNAFTTRTASQIVQENFNVAERFQSGGPLFGVQFSQLPCSDFNRSFTSGGPKAGPQRSPLGLSADPGGLPLYKNGVLVGGIGVEADGFYTLDANIYDYDADIDEIIAIAGTVGFDTPGDIRANRITAGGRTLRFSDVDVGVLAVPASPVGVFTPIAVSGYADATIIAGQSYGDPASGYKPDNGALYPEVQAFVLDFGNGVTRFAPMNGLAPVGAALTAAEVQRLITEGLKVAFAGRAQIRRPLDSFIQVTVTVVDADGNILGVARTPDAPVFGTDVSVQKARSATFLSRTTTAAELTAPNIDPGIRAYVDNMRSFVSPTSLADGIAYSARGLGNLARPFYPDGVNGFVFGPLSRVFTQWSPFSTGFQLDLVVSNIVDGVLSVINNLNLPPPAVGCAGAVGVTGNPFPPAGLLPASGGKTRLANGLQIFAGGVPIYRGSTLIGGFGVSGDGIDQDDMIAFLAVNNSGAFANVNNAPAAIRSDTLTPQGTRLRYVSCPFKPFVDSREQDPCGGGR